MFKIDEIQNHFFENTDFMYNRVQLGNTTILITGLKSLINFPQTIHLIREQILSTTISNLDFLDVFVRLGKELLTTNVENVVSEMLDGMLVAVHEISGTCVSIYPVPQVLSRNVSAPITENNLRSSSSAFNENLDINIGLLRAHMNSNDLQINTFTFGKTVKNKVIISYFLNTIDPSLLQALTEALESNLNCDVTNLQELSKVLNLSKFSLVPRFTVVELPQNAARALKNGKVVLFIDRIAFGLELPSLVSDLFVTEDDKNHSPPFSFLLQLIRLLGTLTTLIAPGLYVALVSINPDVLRFELAHSIAKSRLDVPYPAIIETLLLLFILELIMEAIVRLPSSIGPTVTMVGGIVLGQAVVSAKLVSSLLIIVLAAITISNATVVGFFQNSLSIRFFKYLLLFLASLLGMLGLLSGLVILSAYLASTKTLGIPYLQLKYPKGE